MYSENFNQEALPSNAASTTSAVPIPMEGIPYATTSEPPIAMHIDSTVPVAAAIPVQRINQTAQKYELSDTQKEGAKCLHIYAILLIITSILSNIHPFVMWVIPIDLTISITAASIVLCRTNPATVEQIPSEDINACCGFRVAYGMSIAAAVLQAVFGVVRFYLFILLAPWLFIRRHNMWVWYAFGMLPAIFAVLSVTFASFMAEYSAPDYKLTSLVDANQVLSATPIPEPPEERCCDGCCNGKCSRITCWIFTVFFVLVTIIIFVSSKKKSSGYYYDDNYYDNYYNNYYDDNYYDNY